VSSTLIRRNLFDKNKARSERVMQALKLVLFAAAGAPCIAARSSELAVWYPVLMLAEAAKNDDNSERS
jgi:hypothetical protein